MLPKITDVQELRKDKGYYREADGSGSVFILSDGGKTRAMIKKPGGISFKITNEDLAKRPLYEGEKPELVRIRPCLSWNRKR